MPRSSQSQTKPLVDPVSSTQLEPLYRVICWDDPVNLMDYVTHVFQKVFGWSLSKAKKHMMEVHEEGQSILIRDSLEQAEHYAHQLQCYHLNATLHRDT
jgi:ATP-dependent Clp protease adaptor protein ClpS